MYSTHIKIPLSVGGITDLPRLFPENAMQFCPKSFDKNWPIFSTFDKKLAYSALEISGKYQKIMF